MPDTRTRLDIAKPAKCMRERWPLAAESHDSIPVLYLLIVCVIYVPPDRVNSIACWILDERAHPTGETNEGGNDAYCLLVSRVL